MSAAGTNKLCGGSTKVIALGPAGQSTVLQLLEEKMGRGILLWLIGIPIPIIILLAIFVR